MDWNGYRNSLESKSFYTIEDMKACWDASSEKTCHLVKIWSNEGSQGFTTGCGKKVAYVSDFCPHCGGIF